MARNVLLQTDTPTLLDVVGNGKTYTIPPYQRDYSWKREQWEDLWVDIGELRDDRDSKHYMGAIVLEAESDRQFSVIDGQRRLATLSVLALAVIRCLEVLAEAGVATEENRERATSLRNRFIGEKNPASLTLVSKLSLNENDDGFYQDYLVRFREPSNVRGLPKSNRLLWDCYRYFVDQISNDDELRNDGLKIAELLNETVARQLLFISITVDDELNAYTVFETLNARGVDLSTTDLLKNFLFSRVKTSADIRAIRRKWQRLIGTVRQERFPSFLRYHLLVESPRVRANQMYKLIRERIRESSDVLELMDALEDRAELFTALSDPTHEYWIETPEARPLINERVLYADTQSTPLLFAAWRALDRRTFVDVLRMVNVVTFRFNTIGKLNSNDLEPAYHHAAKAVADGAAVTAADVFVRLESIYVDDGDFRRRFIDATLPTNGRRKKLVKFILCRLESDQSGGHLDFETDPGSIEHILPENPNHEWDETIPPEVATRVLYRLGNLTLLERKLNRDVGNGPFDAKIRTYARSGYAMTRTLGEEPPAEWNAKAIESRQREMAKRAVHLWRVG